jgi:lipopolysaccharide export system permease protein
MEAKQKNINKHWIAIFDKFMIAFSCILMFFIGAPLGAIIRKGGIGLPIVFSVIIFIIFHFINTFGKRLAQENGISPFLGVWLSSLILLPLALLLTYRAINDIGGMVTFDIITEPILKFFKKKSKEDITQLPPSPDKIDSENGTGLKTIEPIDLSNLNYEMVIKMNNKALLLYGIVFFVAILTVIINTTILLVGLFAALIMLLIYVYKLQQEIHKNAPGFEPGIVISLLTAFPFFPLNYWYIQNQINNSSTKNNA